MSAIEIGRICIKTHGRETGSKCVIIDVVDRSFVLVTGPKELTGVRRRRVNIMHLKASEEKIEVDRGATDEEVIGALKKANKLEEMKDRVKMEV